MEEKIQTLFIFLKVFCISSFISSKLFSFIFGKAIITISVPFLSESKELLTASFIRLLALFLSTALGETFLLTIKPILGSGSLVFKTLKYITDPLIFSPCFKTFSKSFFFFNLFFKGSIMLNRKLCSFFSSSSLQNLSSACSFRAFNKTMGCFPFFLFWPISCNSHNFWLLI